MGCFATVYALDAFGSFLKHGCFNSANRCTATEFEDQVSEAAVVTNGRLEAEVLALDPVLLPTLRNLLERVAGRRDSDGMRARRTAQLRG